MTADFAVWPIPLPPSWWRLFRAVHPAGPGNTSPRLPAESCGPGLELTRCQKTLATAPGEGVFTGLTDDRPGVTWPAKLCKRRALGQRLP